ncbi:DUF2236 domain-containing protein [Pseudonocardiaceae bacterium YIM PH 21723]|nr:DUF2236 domain-containing protein [Pseudonocardiaceae bacterium YIM PH 21723]
MTASRREQVDPPLDELPAEIRNNFILASTLAAQANIVMQLAWLPVGHGVALSTVDSGRIDKRPIKRARTTMSYLAVAMMGTDEERAWMRSEIDKQHRHVHSEPGAAVKYNAFSRDLQLWVAACLYQGAADLAPYVQPDITESRMDAVYRYSARLATTLQVTPEMWPADRAAFRAYWDDMLPRMSVDEISKRYLLDIVVDAGFLPWVLRRPARPLIRFFSVGFLHQPFRELLDLEWDDRSQRRFDRVVRAICRLNLALPGPLRYFPWNFYLWDFRRRMRKQQAFV